MGIDKNHLAMETNAHQQNLWMIAHSKPLVLCTSYKPYARVFGHLGLGVWSQDVIDATQEPRPKCMKIVTLQGTNISHFKVAGKMNFLSIGGMCWFQGGYLILTTG